MAIFGGYRTEAITKHSANGGLAVHIYHYVIPGVRFSPKRFC